ncbi:heavy metal translocating P-type ATPase [Rhodoblastus sp.]|uniref:heavy metal translocating P-type ATPase n=1 Tax=Rhodoblastus sp. TaxID=1962975 RepID=UPI003F95CF88
MNIEAKPDQNDACELKLGVGGMTCAACVRHVEKALKQAPGVIDAHVNLVGERANLTLAPGADLSEIAARVREAGYEPRLTHIELGVGGMTCAACAAHVEKALKSAPGVVAARVNLAIERAYVDGIEGVVEEAALAAAVRGAGYEPRPLAAEGARLDPVARRAAETDVMRRRFALAALSAAPVSVLEMGGHVSPAFAAWLHGVFGHQNLTILVAALTSFVLFVPGRRFFTVGLPGLLRGAPDMNALVALGAGAAYLYSLLATFAPQFLPVGARHSYFESAATIVTFILLGRWLEARSRGRAADAIGKLARLQPRIAHVRRQDGPGKVAVLDLPVEQVVVGDVIETRPGESIPVDGVVSEGASHVDESFISGEAAPVAKKPGDAVTGGGVNLAGAFAFRATKVGADTFLADVIRMVETAQGARLPIQDLADRVTAIFVPAVMAAALATFALWLYFAGASNLTLALVSAVNVLIIACPCAMGLATPAALVTGTGRAAELGVIFRQGDALQTLCGVKTVAFDKTGTLTEGRPVLTRIVAGEGFEAQNLLALAAAVEARSEHPLGRALVEAAKARQAPAAGEVAHFAYQPGLGVSGEVDGRSVAVGSAAFLASRGGAPDSLAETAEELAGQGASCFFVAIDGRPAGLFAFSDPPRPQAAQAVKALHDLGLRVALITGDREATARFVGAKIGVDEIFAGRRPEGKVAALRELARSGPVAFVGDGINDAPALAAADVGIAMGAGTDIAVESAQVALMSSDLGKVAQAFALSRATLRNIKQNLAWAFGYNVILIPVAMGVLYPAFGIMLNPSLGAAAMASSSLFVLGNALRLRRFAIPSGSDGDQPMSAPASTIFSVSDMTCGHCAARVKTAVLSLEPAAEVEVDLASGDVRVTPPAADPAAVAMAIAEAGYPASEKKFDKK